MLLEGRAPEVTQGQRRLALRLQDAGGWSSSLAGIARAARSDMHGREGVIDGARTSAMQQLRLLREMRTRQQQRAEQEEERQMRVADGIVVDAEGAEPCLTEEWQLLEDLHGSASSSLLDLDLKAPGRYVAPDAVPQQLFPGSRFRGSQSFSRGCLACDGDDWEVSAQIEECNWQTGYICGTMTAVNVPQTVSSVSTFFEGNIVGLGKHTFLTGDWGADRRSDQHHWARFPAFQRVQRRAIIMAAEGSDGDEAGPSQPPSPPEDVVFMRWKEKSFETKYGEGCGLTITGFYFMCLNCATSELSGYYYDASSQPFQRITMTSAGVRGASGRGSHSSSAYQFN